MPNGERAGRGITARENWGLYALGILTESAFILGLTALALLMAVVAVAVYAR